MDFAKWEAFRHTRKDDLDSLEQVLAPYETDLWRTWRNFAGRTLYQVAEHESKREFRKTRCHVYLRAHLQKLGLKEEQAIETYYLNTVVEVPQVVQTEVEVEVPEVHYHKTLKYAPEPIIKEVIDVVEVPQITWKEEL